MEFEDTNIIADTAGFNTHRQAMDVEGDGFTLLRAEIVATMLGLSKPRVYQLARNGDIPCVKIGKSTRFFRDDVKTFILSRWRNGESS